MVAATARPSKTRFPVSRKSSRRWTISCNRPRKRSQLRKTSCGPRGPSSIALRLNSTVSKRVLGRATMSPPKIRSSADSLRTCRYLKISRWVGAARSEPRPHGCDAVLDPFLGTSYFKLVLFSSCSTRLALPIPTRVLAVKPANVPDGQVMTAPELSRQSTAPSAQTSTVCSVAPSGPA